MPIMLSIAGKITIGLSDNTQKKSSFQKSDDFLFAVHEYLAAFSGDELCNIMNCGTRLTLNNERRVFFVMQVNLTSEYKYLLRSSKSKSALSENIGCRRFVYLLFCTKQSSSKKKTKSLWI